MTSRIYYIYWAICVSIYLLSVSIYQSIWVELSIFLITSDFTHLLHLIVYLCIYPPICVSIFQSVYIYLSFWKHLTSRIYYIYWSICVYKHLLSVSIYQSISEIYLSFWVHLIFFLSKSIYQFVFLFRIFPFTYQPFHTSICLHLYICVPRYVPV